MNRLAVADVKATTEVASGLGDATLVIVSDFGYVNGGAAQVAIESAIGLARRGLSVRFAYAVGPIDERLAAAGVTPLRFHARDVWSIKDPVSAAMLGIWNGKVAAELSEALGHLDRSRTVIHFHQWTKAFSPSAIIAALKLELPCVVTLHDYFFSCPNGAYYNFPAAQPCRLKPMSVGCVLSNCDSRSRAHKLVRIARHSVQSAFLRQQEESPLFVFPSRFARNICTPMLPAASRTCVLENPILVPDLPRATAEENSKYLYVGRLVPEKGCVAFARAAREAAVPALFVGSGPCEAEIRKANPDAELLGWVPRDEVQGVMRRARALVFPSQWYETFGLVCAEALSHGIPVLAATCTGAADLIRDGVNGATFEANDERRMVELLRLLEVPANVKRMSIEAYSRARHDHWTTETHVNGLVQIYQSLIRRDTCSVPLATLVAQGTPVADHSL